MILDQGGNFEKPDSNSYVGVIADVVELFGVHSQYGDRNKIRIIWVLDKNDSTGKPYRVMRQVNASLNEKSDFYKIVTSIFGQAPPIKGFDTESLLGRANQLFIMKEKAVDGKEFANVKGIMPLPAGSAIPQVPADFVRAKDRKPFVPGANAQTAQTPAPQPQPAATTPSATGNTQSAPAPQSNVQF